MASSSRSVPIASEFAVYSGSSKDDGDVALRAEVVDLVRLHLLHHVDEARRVGEIAVSARRGDDRGRAVPRTGGRCGRC